jgi:exonuclease III
VRVKLVSWNVNGNPAVASQATALRAESPDLVALQEVRRGTLGPWAEELRAQGFEADSIRSTEHLVGRRRNFLITASRHPVVRVEPASAVAVPYPERLQTVTVNVDGVELQLTNTHVPDGSSHGWRKVEHFEALYSSQARGHGPDCPPRALCGDFNSPRAELPDGRVLTWAQRRDGRLRASRGHRWDAAERSVILGLAAFDLHDAYRLKHPYGSRPAMSEASWVWNGRGWRAGRRFDHVFVSERLAVESCDYIHRWRTREPPLSDHSVIAAELSL